MQALDPTYVGFKLPVHLHLENGSNIWILDILTRWIIIISIEETMIIGT